MLVAHRRQRAACFRPHNQDLGIQTNPIRLSLYNGQPVSCKRKRSKAQVQTRFATTSTQLVTPGASLSACIASLSLSSFFTKIKPASCGQFSHAGHHQQTGRSTTTGKAQKPHQSQNIGDQDLLETSFLNLILQSVISEATRTACGASPPAGWTCLRTTSRRCGTCRAACAIGGPTSSSRSRSCGWLKSLPPGAPSPRRPSCLDAENRRSR
jgi:hypothetical protein